MKNTGSVSHPSVGSLVSGGSAAAHAARNSGAVEALARMGLAARGLTYLVIALIAGQIAFGATAQSADQHGALEDIAARPFGRVLLIAMAIGFAAYALWRWSVAVLGGTGAETLGQGGCPTPRSAGDWCRLRGAVHQHDSCDHRSPDIVEHSGPAERDRPAPRASPRARAGDRHRGRHRHRRRSRDLEGARPKVREEPRHGEDGIAHARLGRRHGSCRQRRRRNRARPRRDLPHPGGRRQQSP